MTSLINFSNKNYNRIFSFGCSFTRYYYPTWANIIASQFPKTDHFINFGVSGSGNSLLFTRLAQVHSKFKIQKDDLVLIMYPSYTREDRFLSEGIWHTPGNIFNTRDISSEALNFYKSYGCYLHYMIRDMSYIFMIESFLEKLECDKFTLLSASLTDVENTVANQSASVLIEEKNKQNYENLLNTYNPLLSKFPSAYHEFLYKNYISIQKPSGVRLGNEHDSHPTPLQAVEYLQHIGLQLNQSALEYADIHNKIIFSCQNLEQVKTVYKDMQEKYDYYIMSNGII